MTSADAPSPDGPPDVTAPLGPADGSHYRLWETGGG
jgi:hypothetical protein